MSLKRKSGDKSLFQTAIVIETVGESQCVRVEPDARLKRKSGDKSPFQTTIDQGSPNKQGYGKSNMLDMSHRTHETHSFPGRAD
jgi:hypothetical protein